MKAGFQEAMRAVSNDKFADAVSAAIVSTHDAVLRLIHAGVKKNKGSGRYWVASDMLEHLLQMMNASKVPARGEFIKSNPSEGNKTPWFTAHQMDFVQQNHDFHHQPMSDLTPDKFYGMAP